MTSRFFMSDSESESESSEEEIINEPTGISAAAFAFSEDEEDTKRIVRSAKEKRYEELKNIIKNIKNYKKNKDMSSLLSSFEDLCRAYAKALPVVQKEEGGKTPRFYIRCLAELDDFIQSVWEDKTGRKNMSKNNAKGLTTLRQKYRKYAKDYEGDMAVFRENPDAPDSDAEVDRDDQDDESEDDNNLMDSAPFKKEASVTKAPKKFVKGSDDEDDDDDDSIDWGPDSDDETSSSDGGGGMFTLREKFLKKTTDRDDDDIKKKKKRLPRENKAKDEDSDDDGGWETVKKGSSMPMEKPKMFGKDDEININSVHKKLNEIMAARGKKGTDRKEQIELLHELLNVARDNALGHAILVKVQFSIIMSVYDYNPSVSDPMKVEFWEKVLIKIDELLDMLVANPDLAIGEHVTEETESLEKPPLLVRGCVLTIVDRMDEEFIKLLKACDAHSNEYIVSLRDEIRVCAIIDKLLKYEEEHGMPADICRVYLRKIEHLYYKYEPRAAKQTLGELPVTDDTSLAEMDRLCKYIYVRDNTDRLRTRAVLCHIYHMSLHDKWYEARDLMLMAHLQETIHHSDLPTQILYNRTMVQLGLCAFRHGNIKEAHNALLDIQSGGRAKELLAQGLLPQRQHERTTEQEKQEKQRQIPFHQHINLEMLECVYLVSAMLIEIPYMAAHEFDARRRMISKSFHHQLKNSERQSLVGPPESMREHVVAASKAMRNGNWKQCRNLLLNDKMNAKVWDLFHEADRVRKMLGGKIQEESLRTYLFTYSHVYDSISLIKLSEMFELPHSTVHAIISKMIINEEIMASLDEPTSCLVMHRTEPSSLQSLSLQLADKLYNLVENNERVLDQKPFFTRGMQGGGYRDRREKGNWGDRRGGRDRDNQNIHRRDRD
ncbi:eukaryotic translation initiation factor 3 subunit C [Procambarus clarkii]|uniref:eukaryotic translation initiation factor 3 subunit C n=1 Tax=Procambarus clarkii TaxID=6728 RepID=UPI001E6735C8|nr:eukaryotic translation initiation factor 3 subunit C-like [Procambarus clarkii]XP_045582242.1 eukaryotic translation initiation factor 3 subunit C-like [Procambarus clarkii]